MIEFELADWSNPDDCSAVVSLLQSYALHPMGGGEPLSEHAAQNLPSSLARVPGAFSVIGWQTLEGGGKKAVALANCFTAFSTFACLPLINIHDLFVHDDARGRGTGQAILQFVENQAQQRGCCKVTLEVLTGNEQAMRAYERYGFEKYELDAHHGHALLMQKSVVRLA